MEYKEALRINRALGDSYAKAKRLLQSRDLESATALRAHRDFEEKEAIYRKSCAYIEGIRRGGVKSALPTPVGDIKSQRVRDFIERLKTHKPGEDS